MNPFRSKRDQQAERAQHEAELARGRAERRRDAARRAAEEARVAARHARELGRIAAEQVGAQARQLREPAGQAARRARTAGLQAWGRRDEAKAGASRAGRFGARASLDLASAIRRGVDRLRPGSQRKRRSRRGPARWLAGAIGMLAAGAGLAALARPRLRSTATERLRALPDRAKDAPQRARQMADEAIGRARGFAGGVASRAPHRTAAEPAEATIGNGHGGGVMRGVAAVPRAIRDRFRASVDEGKRHAQETETAMRERYEAKKDGSGS